MQHAQNTLSGSHALSDLKSASEARSMRLPECCNSAADIDLSPYSACVEIKRDLLLVAVQDLCEVSMGKEYVSFQKWVCRLAGQPFNPDTTSSKL